MNAPDRLILALAFLLASTPGISDEEDLGWPVVPTDGDHPLGGTLGEFERVNENGAMFQHNGLDILAVADPSPGAPDVVATVSGFIASLHNVLNDRDNELVIDGDDGLRYVYHHLAFDTFDANIVNAYKSEQVHPPIRFTRGTRIAKVTQYPCNSGANYDHLHYDISNVDVGIYKNPLLTLGEGVDPDTQAPDVFKVRLAKRAEIANRWNPLAAPQEHACAVVAGNIDIIAKIRDRDDAGSSLPGATSVGPYNLRWRACSRSNLSCAWNETQDYETMPGKLYETGNQESPLKFSVTTPWISHFDECSSTVNETFAVLTGGSDTGWRTRGDAYPDGSYVVTVEASDVAGNKGESSVLACVENSGQCTTDLMIRDGPTESGSLPDASQAVISPDILINPGIPDAGVRRGVANTIQVRVWNSGSCPLSAGTNYQVCLGWSLMPATTANSGAAVNALPCRTESVAASGWLPGTNQTSTFVLSLPSTARLGKVRLEAWTSIPDDPLQSPPSIIGDNNRAALNSMITAVP